MKIDSNLVKKLRTAENWSQEQLSEKSGLSLRTIQRLENGDNAAIESVRALAAKRCRPQPLVAAVLVCSVWANCCPYFVGPTRQQTRRFATN